MHQLKYNSSTICLWCFYRCVVTSPTIGSGCFSFQIRKGLQTCNCITNTRD